jgi:8-amino-7-oxononanoate synthase
MGLFDRFDGLAKLHAMATTGGEDPFAVRMDRVLSPTEAIINGRQTILIGTHNYLGLTFDPACIEASQEAAAAFGTGTTGSRIANGSYAGHRGLEKTLAAFFGRKHCMVFSTGYQANLGILSTVAGPQDHLLIDADSHASIYDACKLGSATVVRFRHNDPADLDRRLQKLSGEPGNRVIVAEGLYSMLGDTAPLREFVEVKKKHGAYIVLDEAHSVGTMGENGRGLAEAEGLEADVDFVVGTFSKSFGAVGGFCVSDMEGFEVLRIASRPYMFTASLPPSIMASVTEAVHQVQARPELRRQLWQNVDRLYDGLQKAGFILGPEKAPVVAITLRDQETAIRFWNGLLANGVYCALVLPPATPNGLSLCRLSLCAAHTAEQIKRVVELATRVANEIGAFDAVPAKRAAAG